MEAVVDFAVAAVGFGWMKSRAGLGAKKSLLLRT